jgi:2-iminobutanoate/2-iminopropanoate deaminase
MSATTMRQAVNSENAPPPAGTYSQAIVCGDLVFLSGQTPRDASGNRVGHLPFEDQVRQTLDNLNAVASELGLSLHDAVKVTVYLKNPARAPDFDKIYRGYVAEPWPARSLVQSGFIDFELEVDAILKLRS